MGEGSAKNASCEAMGRIGPHFSLSCLILLDNVTSLDRTIGHRNWLRGLFRVDARPTMKGAITFHSAYESECWPAVIFASLRVPIWPRYRRNRRAMGWGNLFMNVRISSLIALLLAALIMSSCAPPRPCPPGWHPGPYGRRCFPDAGPYPPPPGYLPPPGAPGYAPPPPPPGAYPPPPGAYPPPPGSAPPPGGPPHS